MDSQLAAPSSDRQALEVNVFDSVVTLIDEQRAYLVDNGSTDGLSFTQIAALWEIREHQPIPSRQLGKLLRITPGAVTQLVDVLENETLVIRGANAKDRRITELSLTLRGKDCLEETTRRRLATFVEVYNVLDDSEMTELYTMIRKLLDNLHSLQAKK